MHVRRVLALLFLIVLSAGTAAQQSETQYAQEPVGWSLQLRSVQLEGSVLPSARWELSVDVDVYHLPSAGYGSFGVRLGREQFATYNPGGGGKGPFTDYNLLLRYSTGDAALRLDFCAGYSYRPDTQAHWYTPIAASGVKFDVNVRLNFAEFLYFGVIGKACLYKFYAGTAPNGYSNEANTNSMNSGIGLYGGWDNR